MSAAPNLSTLLKEGGACEAPSSVTWPQFPPRVGAVTPALRESWGRLRKSRLSSFLIYKDEKRHKYKVKAALQLQRWRAHWSLLKWRSSEDQRRVRLLTGLRGGPLPPPPMKTPEKESKLYQSVPWKQKFRALGAAETANEAGRK